MKLINIGFGNTVPTSRIIAVVSPESAPIKRLIQDRKEAGLAIDGTLGRRLCFQLCNRIQFQLE